MNADITSQPSTTEPLHHITMSTTVYTSSQKVEHDQSHPGAAEADATNVSKPRCTAMFSWVMKQKPTVQNHSKDNVCQHKITHQAIKLETTQLSTRRTQQSRSVDRDIWTGTFLIV